MCQTFEMNGRCWLKVLGLVRNKVITIPLNTTMSHAPSGTLRFIIRQDKIEVHYQQEVAIEQTCGDQSIEIDKGFTEAVDDSDNERYGEGLGKVS
jgi:hypothetical protein